MKDLILKFGFRSLTQLCDEKGWGIPSSSDLREFDSFHESVWVSDPIPDDEEVPDNYAMVYSYSDDRTYKCNKSFMQEVVVVK